MSEEKREDTAQMERIRELHLIEEGVKDSTRILREWEEAMSFSERLEDSEKGTAYFIKEGFWYLVIITPDHYRLYTIRDNHNLTVEKIYDHMKLDEKIHFLGLEKADWTFI